MLVLLKWVLEYEVADGKYCYVLIAAINNL
jgi:hypothetical protein